MNNTPIPGPLTPGPIGKSGPAGKAVSAEKSRVSDVSTPEFQVLLERLQQRAAELEKTSRTIEAPEQMAEAMGSAQSSLEEAQALSDRLLEAFREVTLQESPRGSETTGTEEETR